MFQVSTSTEGRFFSRFQVKSFPTGYFTNHNVSVVVSITLPLLLIKETVNVEIAPHGNIILKEVDIKVTSRASKKFESFLSNHWEIISCPNKVRLRFVLCDYVSHLVHVFRLSHISDRMVINVSSHRLNLRPAVTTAIISRPNQSIIISINISIHWLLSHVDRILQAGSAESIIDFV